MGVCAGRFTYACLLVSHTVTNLVHTLFTGEVAITEIAITVNNTFYI